MLKYTTRYVNIVSLLITIIIFISINLITPLFNKINKYPISKLLKKNSYEKSKYISAGADGCICTNMECMYRLVRL